METSTTYKKVNDYGYNNGTDLSYIITGSMNINGKCHIFVFQGNTKDKKDKYKTELVLYPIHNKDLDRLSKKDKEKNIHLKKEHKSKAVQKEKAAKALKALSTKSSLDNFFSSLSSSSIAKDVLKEEREYKIEDCIKEKEIDFLAPTLTKKGLAKVAEIKEKQATFPPNAVRLINANIIYNNKSLIKKKFILCNEGSNPLLDKLVLSNSKVMDEIIFKQLCSKIKKFVLGNSTKKGCRLSLPIYYAIYKSDETPDCIPPIYKSLSDAWEEKNTKKILNNSLEESNFYFSVNKTPISYLKKYKGLIKSGTLYPRLS